MLDIIVRAGSFIAIIAMGFILRRIGFFKEKDFDILAKICIRITLPCAIITSFSGKTIDPALLTLPVMALACGAIYIALGYVLNRGKDRETQAFSMLNLAGYNIGTFVIPFAQSFLGPMGVVAVSIFDTGNAVICLGGGYSVASMVKDGGGFSAKRLARSLGTSVPFITYMTMLVMNLMHLNVPGFVLSVAEVGSGANAFMAMLMIGVGFRLSADRTQLAKIGRILAVRYAVAAAFALAFYFLTPFALEIRQALVLLAFAPIGSAVPAFTREMDSDVGLSSAINSIAMVISIAIIVTLLVVMV